MKIIVEIDLPDIEPDAIYKPDSGWFTKPGFIDIDECYLEEIEIINHRKNRFKYLGQVQDEIRP